MQRMPLEVRHMRHVIALAEHGSFARAATALGLSQSALSRSIQSVEREIGSSLFVRTASGVDPTDGGHVFIARVRQLAQLTDDLDRAGLGLRLRWLSGGMSDEARTVQRYILPERAGYWIGAKMVEDAIAERGIAWALRAEAQELMHLADAASRTA
mgnify:CR=1 FL=1